MPQRYTDIQWVVQRNLTHAKDLENLELACKQKGIPFLMIDVIPFTAELPYFDTSRRSIFYGSTTFCALVDARPELRTGLFFDNTRFSIANYIGQWGKYMLNADAEITSFRELMSRNEAADKLFFIRPDDDNKAFAGETKSFGELSKWYDQLSMWDNTSLSPDSRIVVSTPYDIRYEWRLWIVVGKVVAASKYRTYFKLTKEAGCPPEVIAYAESRCREYMPHDVFVMDICLCGEEFYIVECGCMNAAGFYHAAIADIVEAVSGYFVGRNDRT
ncbi:uncharacterized protein DUF4343 [Chitinophaga polysaccharea]|uniref:Uncharacterized protein DUF4343 n=1 Tax=Chitinophaga polysaccharea TaxID=1293035 RepID=A0A561PLG1_9BACT|nr:ATP-grasp domain-containing protein [Chitinophaga polysaccharea]TWF38949.1 uncharacterized protein DUF4343 [Chitinophaga polysaccharea]